MFFIYFVLFEIFERHVVKTYYVCIIINMVEGESNMWLTNKDNAM